MVRERNIRIAVKTRNKIIGAMEQKLHMLAEATTTELVKVQNPQGLTENKSVLNQGNWRQSLHLWFP